MSFSDYEVVQTKEGISLTGDVASTINRFYFIQGLCAADPQNPTNPRDRQWYAENVIDRLLQQGEIDNGTRTPFDDRKLRIDGITRIGDRLEIAVGSSHYAAFREDQQRSDEDNRALQQKGLQDFNDRWAYFQRNPGVAGLVLSSTGSLYVGQRTNTDATGKLNAVAGHMTYKKSSSDGDIVADLHRKLQGEMGIESEEIVSLRFVGAYGHPLKGDMDFAWIVKTSLPDDYFSAQGAWHERRKSKEHEDLIRLTTQDEVKLLLEEGRIQGRDKIFQLMYSTRGALENLNESDFRSL